MNRLFNRRDFQHSGRIFCQLFGETTFSKKLANYKNNPNIVTTLVFIEFGVRIEFTICVYIMDRFCLDVFLSEMYNHQRAGQRPSELLSPCEIPYRSPGHKYIRTQRKFESDSMELVPGTGTGNKQTKQT